jgi:RNA polymerase sigma-70 factor (ECF subfamily)
VNEPDIRIIDFIEAMAEGDRPALEHLYRKTCDKLYGVVLRILRKPALADAALPEAYARIWREAGNYDPALLNPAAWLVMHARRAALDLARDVGQLPQEAVSEEIEQTTDAEETESGHPISDELRELLGCLATLSSDPRVMLLLAYYDGWSRSELAVEFDAPVPTIRTWMLRGLEQIRECTSR